MPQVVVSSHGCIPERVVACGDDPLGTLLRVAGESVHDDAGFPMLGAGDIQGGCYLADGDWEFRLMDLDD